MTHTIEDDPERNFCYAGLNTHTEDLYQAPHIYWKAKGGVGDRERSIWFLIDGLHLKNSNLLPSLISISLLPSIFNVPFLLEELSDTVRSI